MEIESRMNKLITIRDKMFSFSQNPNDNSLSIIEVSPSDEPISFKMDLEDYASAESAEKFGIKFVELRIAFRKQNPLDR